MRNRILAVAFAVAAMCASAADYTWQPTSNTSILTALDWNTEDNWSPNTGTPTTSEDKAAFQNVGTSTTYYFVTSAVPVAVGYIQSLATPARAVFVSDSAISVNAAGKGNKHIRFYAPVSCNNTTLLNGTVYFCDAVSVAANKAMVLDYANAYFYSSRFAKSSATSRENEFDFGSTGIGLSGGYLYMYGPGRLANAATSAWVATAGSPYLTPVGNHQSGLTMPAGAPVSCVGVIPDGAFLKRVFPNGEIEISEPALADSSSASVTFEAFTPSVRQSLKLYFHGADASTVLFNKASAAEDYELTLEGIDWKSENINKRLTINNVDGNIVWAPVVHVIGDCSPDNWVPAVACHIAKFSLEGTGETVKNGFAHSCIRHLSANSRLQLSVPSGMTQNVYQMTNLLGYVTKEGLGTLVTGMPDSSRNTGMIQINAGTFAVTDDTSAPIAEIGTLTVAANAALRLPVQGMRSNTALTFNSGAILETPVTADGTTAALSVAGSATVSAGTVRLSGDTRNLKAGDHVVLSGAGLSSADGWSVDPSTVREGCTAALKVVSGNLVMAYRIPTGLTLIIK